MPSLVVVESPAKAKTIEKYLGGKSYTVKASYGHVRDLEAKEGAVDPANGYAMRYRLVEKNEKHVQALITAMKKCDTLLLATDPDREGEAIAWHVYALLEDAGVLKDKVTVKRVAFNEITKQAVKEAIDNPRELAESLINAQQARRALDYLVGFTLSPLLWKKVRPGLSAGRVQSPALRLLAERENAIRIFEPKEYWSIEAQLTKGKKTFGAKLTVLDAEKQKQFSITDEKTASAAVKTLTSAADGQLVVQSIENKTRKRNPAPPFTTSTLQQEASRKCGFGASRTMRIAQQLYEGIDVGSGAEGLITYMRTDSVTLSQVALDDMRTFIQETYGDKDLPEAPRVFKNKSKNAQEAHEAIRPTNIYVTPEKVKAHLKPEQLKLYELIWKRTLASQMMHATIDSVGIDLVCGTKQEHVFRANGSVIKEPGFLRLYEEGQDDVKNEKDVQLPAMKEGETVPLKSITPSQHFTEPPPRFSEATLVKALEEYGIGRPSTYASILSTLQQREYAVLEKKRFKTTDVGDIVARFLTEYFQQYVDYEFTAQLEDDLDRIANGEKEWVPILDTFWHPFKALVESTEKSVSRQDVTHEALDENCPECQKPLSIRLGRRGRFVGCTGYPECKYTRSLDGEPGESNEPEVVEGRQCPECTSDLVIKTGRYGKFIGCSNYPKCKHMEPLEKPQDTGVSCAECKEGTLLKRKSRYGKIFYSCSRYPDCKYAVWNEPVAEACPECDWPVTTIKTTKRRGTERVCPQKECGFAEPHTGGNTPTE